MGLSYNEHVSAEIRAEMARQRIGQSELASRLDWTRNKLSRRLSDQTRWSVDEVDEVAQALGVPLPVLVGP